MAAASGRSRARRDRAAVLTAARSDEVRGATWGELDLEAAIWTVPAGRMKAGREHRVPLAEQTLEVLAELRPHAAGEAPSAALVFSSRPRRGLSDAPLAAVLKRLDVPVTVHGFRSTFRDWVEEQTSTPHAVAEAALAHAVADKVEAAYRRGDLFAKRVELMAAWGRFVTSGGGV